MNEWRLYTEDKFLIIERGGVEYARLLTTHERYDKMLSDMKADILMIGGTVETGADILADVEVVDDADIEAVPATEGPADT